MPNGERSRRRCAEVQRGCPDHPLASGGRRQSVSHVLADRPAMIDAHCRRFLLGFYLRRECLFRWIPCLRRLFRAESGRRFHGVPDHRANPPIHLARCSMLKVCKAIAQYATSRSTLAPWVEKVAAQYEFMSHVPEVCQRYLRHCKVLATYEFKALHFSSRHLEFSPCLSNAGVMQASLGTRVIVAGVSNPCSNVYSENYSSGYSTRMHSCLSG